MSVVPGRDGVLVACQAKRFRLACAIVGAAAAALVACSAFEASARSNGPGEAAAAVAEAGFDAVVSGANARHLLCRHMNRRCSRTSFSTCRA